jgi:hypothetical protein
METVEKLGILAIVALTFSMVFCRMALQRRHKEENRAMRDHLNRISQTSE